MGTKSAKSKTTKKTERVRTPWLRLKKMWENGATYEQMAKATDAHYDPKKPDPTKPTRAKICKARNEGVQIGEKLVKFGERGMTKKPSGNKVKKARRETTSGTKKVPKPVPPKTPEIAEAASGASQLSLLTNRRA